VAGQRRPGRHGRSPRSLEELSCQDFDLLVVCVAGWIPSHTVIDVISPFAHKPMVLWGLTGYYDNGRLVTTADQAGTSARCATRWTPWISSSSISTTPSTTLSLVRAKVPGIRQPTVARAATLLRRSRIGMMGYRDMRLYATLVDGVSLRRVVGTEVDVFETLEVAQRHAGERKTPRCRPCWTSSLARLGI